MIILRLKNQSRVGEEPWQQERVRRTSRWGGSPFCPWKPSCEVQFSSTCWARTSFCTLGGRKGERGFVLCLCFGENWGRILRVKERRKVWEWIKESERHWSRRGKVGQKKGRRRKGKRGRSDSKRERERERDAK